MAKYGERISGRPCYQAYRQKECNWSGVGGVGGRLATTSGYPKTLAEEVQWRQRRFAWWGSEVTPPTPDRRPFDVSRCSWRRYRPDRILLDLIGVMGCLLVCDCALFLVVGWGKGLTILVLKAFSGILWFRFRDSTLCSHGDSLRMLWILG